MNIKPNISFIKVVLGIALASNLALAAEPNTLSDQEKAQGWKLLFDGKSTSGWVAIGKDAFPDKGWSVKEGTLEHAKSGGGGDIVTTANYLNFELKWDWKIGSAGNSGVKYNLPQPNKNVGFEYQLLDDQKHADSAKSNHQTGALYDLIAPAAERKVNAVGEWNESRLLVDGARAEHWLNGIKIVSFEIGSPELLELVSKSKYSKVKDFGQKIASPILLQDHGDETTFRNVKIRELPSK